MLQTTTPATRCQPWCTDHADGTPNGQTVNPADQLCAHRTQSPAFGEILTIHSTDEGTRVLLHNLHDDLTPTQVEALAYALLATVATTRTAVAA